MHKDYFSKIINKLIGQALVYEFRKNGGCRTQEEFKNKYTDLFTLPSKSLEQPEELARWINEFIALVNKYNIELGIDHDYLVDENSNPLPITSETFSNVAQTLHEVLYDPTRYYTDDLLNLLNDFYKSFSEIGIGSDKLYKQDSISTKQGLINFLQ